MDKVLLQFENLKIRLEEIITATGHFDDKNCIGVGGFGKVYKGEVSHSKGRSMAAIKRLDQRHGQGTPEFLKEITTLSRYRHKNLVSLLGFCYQGDEMILVFEYASNESLDRHLNSPNLTWSRRIKIGLDAAKGLSYLHDPRGTHQRLIHCDVKSANILLDDLWNAKVSDFGFSIMGPANEQQSTIINLAAGTHGYVDPLYQMTSTLTKESDVYSFGVVLFEVLCGTLCFTYNNGRFESLVPTWIKNYEQKKLDDIIFKNPTIQPLDQSALEIFSDIAYRCLKESREDRPKMAEVVTELENALESQELLENQEFKGEWNKQRSYYEKITKSATPPLNYRSEVELMKLLSKGVLLNGGKTWFSLNKKGEHCEMISIAECLDTELDKAPHRYISRFPMGTYQSYTGEFNAHVKTQFLSTGITYKVNLVFKFLVTPSNTDYGKRLTLKYKLKGETETSISHLTYEREDGWWTCELYQFTSDDNIVQLQILFHGCLRSIEVEGIEFAPLENVENNNETQSISNSDANWEEKLPTDYENIMTWSTNSMQWTTKKEAYLIIREGFLISDDSIWFFLDKNGKKCHMVSLLDICGHYVKRLPLSESRFGEAFELDGRRIDIDTEIQSQLVSSETTYATYLVYKLRKHQSILEAPLEVWDFLLFYTRWYISLASPQTPIIRSKAHQTTRNPANTPKVKGLPQQRHDGWMEVQIWEFQTSTTTEMIPMRLKLRYCSDKKLSGLIIVGVEFRPI